LSLRRSNNVSSTYEGYDTSKNVEVVVDISSKKKFFTENICIKDDDNYLKYYDEIFDYKLGDCVYTCAVLNLQCPPLSEFTKNGIDRNVFLFFSLF
jgi:hypothetical protein